jgi:hypothetical protein
MAGRIVLVAAAVVIAAGVAIFAVVLVSDGGARPMTKAQYVARVNAICRSYNARLNRIPAPVAVGNPQAIAQSVGQALPLVVERAEKVRAVEPPAELEPRVRRMFALSDLAVRDLRYSLAHARANRLVSATQALGRFLRTSGRAKDVAREIGLSC